MDGDAPVVLPLLSESTKKRLRRRPGSPSASPRLEALASPAGSPRDGTLGTHLPPIPGGAGGPHGEHDGGEGPRPSTAPPVGGVGLSQNEYRIIVFGAGPLGITFRWHTHQGHERMAVSGHADIPGVPRATVDARGTVPLGSLLLEINGVPCDGMSFDEQVCTLRELSDSRRELRFQVSPLATTSAR